MSRKLLSTKRLAVLATAAALTLFGGLAAAGVLPGVAEPDGIDVPGPNDASNGHTDVRGKSADHLSGDSEDDEVTTEDSGKGADISDLATSTDSTGVDKGAEISDAASGGQSQAGEEHPGANVLPTIPATVPDEGDEGISHRP